MAKQRLIIAAGEIGADLCFFPAKHPRTAAPIMLGRRGAELVEVHSHRVGDGRNPSSWLLCGLEQCVQEGSLFLATPVDPLLLLLPLLDKARGSTSGEHRGLFKPLSDVFDADDAALEEHLTRIPGLGKRLVRSRRLLRTPFLVAINLLLPTARSPSSLFAVLPLSPFASPV